MTAPGQFTIRSLLIATMVLAVSVALWVFDPENGRLALGSSVLIGFALFPERFRAWFWAPLAFSVAWQLQRLFFIVDHVPYALLDAGLGLLCFVDLALLSVLSFNLTPLKSDRTKIFFAGTFHTLFAGLSVALMIMIPNWLLEFLDDRFALIGSPIGIPFPFPMTGWQIGVVSGTIAGCALLAYHALVANRCKMDSP
jgi:hypothetical protein